MTNFDEGIHPDINNFIYKTFVTTADENYILARQAFFLEFYSDFFWLSVHAIEKYLKAILLFHGETSKGYSHDIVKLYKAINRFGIEIPVFDKPAFVSDAYWFDSPILYYDDQKKKEKGYLKRLYDRGEPSNRYMLLGYNQTQYDLFKVDHIVYYLRKNCRPLIMHENSKIQNAMIRLYKQPEYWTLNRSLPLEKINEDKERSEFLTKLNDSFAPDIKHDLTAWQTSSKNTPFSEYIHQMRGNIPSERRNRINRFLGWVQENVSCPSGIIDYVRNPNEKSN